MIQELQLAAAMQEPGVFENSLKSMPQFEDASWLIGLSQAARTLGQTKRALGHAQQAVEREPENIEAMLEMSRASFAHASVLVSDPGARADLNASVADAVRYAELIIEAEP